LEEQMPSSRVLQQLCLSFWKIYADSEIFNSLR